MDKVKTIIEPNFNIIFTDSKLEFRILKIEEVESKVSSFNIVAISDNRKESKNGLDNAILLSGTIFLSSSDYRESFLQTELQKFSKNNINFLIKEYGDEALKRIITGEISTRNYLIELIQTRKYIFPIYVMENCPAQMWKSNDKRNLICNVRSLTKLNFDTSINASKETDMLAASLLTYDAFSNDDDEDEYYYLEDDEDEDDNTYYASNRDIYN